MNNFYDELHKYTSLGKEVVVVSVVAKGGSAPAEIGKKMLVSSDGYCFGTIGGGALELYAQKKCLSLFKTRTHLFEKYNLSDNGDLSVSLKQEGVNLPMVCGGIVELFYEFVGPRQYVYIFGGGHCGVALAKILTNLAFCVTIIDQREEIIEQLKEIDHKVCQDLVKYVIENKTILNNSYIVVATPAHLYDFQVLDKIFELGIKPKYFGMLCSKKKIKQYLKQVEEKYGDVDLSHFYSPIGLNIGGSSPEEIAISISSEILSILHDKKDVAHLRDLKDKD